MKRIHNKEQKLKLLRKLARRI